MSESNNAEKSMELDDDLVKKSMQKIKEQNAQREIAEEAIRKKRISLEKEMLSPGLHIGQRNKMREMFGNGHRACNTCIFMPDFWTVDTDGKTISAFCTRMYSNLEFPIIKGIGVNLHGMKCPGYRQDPRHRY